MSDAGTATHAPDDAGQGQPADLVHAQGYVGVANFLDLRENLRLLLMGGLGLTLEDNDTYGRIINRAYQDIWDAHQWSFRLTNTVLNSVAPKSDGFVTMTAGSPSILGIGTHFSLADKGAFIWPTGISGTPLPIADVSGPQIATLTNPYSGPSFVKGSYTIAPLYYLIEDAAEVLTLRCNDVELDKRLREEINEIDPTRTDMGGAPSLLWCYAPSSFDGSCMIELWPVPADRRGYLVDYRRRAPKMVNDTDIPLLKSIMIEEHAADIGCQMMYARTSQRSWLELSELHRTRYEGPDGLGGALAAAKDEDERRVSYRGQITNQEPFDRSGDMSYIPTHSTWFD